MLKNTLNFSQLLLLSRNGANVNLSDYFDFNALTIAFLSHIQAFYQLSSLDFTVLEPFYSSDFNETSQISSISLDGTVLGELHLSHLSFPEFSSLVYYSSSGSIEMVLLDESIYHDYSLNNYLALIYEVSVMWIGEKTFYDKLHPSSADE